MIDRPLGWFGIARLGLVQAGVGSIVVLTTSTMNRIMVVELAFPAMLPGALVGLHYAVQLLRPVWGHGSDTAERRTPWIIFGAIVLAVGAIGAASAVAWMGTNTIGGILAAIGAFTLIGIGVGAAGTSVLALLASRVDSSKRAGAATAVWLMMIAGIVVTAITAGHFLDPYTPKRLIAVTSVVGMTSVLLTIIALWGVESGSSSFVSVRWRPRAAHIGFADAIARVWSNDEARRFTVFVFVSMLAYSAQDLILEPFAGSVFGFTPGETTKLSGTQHAGVFAGMLLVGVLGTVGAAKRGGALRVWSIGGCIASALMLVGLALGAVIGPPWPLSPNVFALGVSNGAFAVAAIGSMMELAGRSGEKRSEGVRMGVWGAAQGIAFGLGGFLGTVCCDLARMLIGPLGIAYALVFFLEAILFLVSALLAFRISLQGSSDRSSSSVGAQPELAEAPALRG